MHYKVELANGIKYNVYAKDENDAKMQAVVLAHKYYGASVADITLTETPIWKEVLSTFKKGK